MLFMMHMLRTFLAPTSSTTPRLLLLKVLTFTMKGFASFDWATYVANDLRKELSDYVNASRGHKDCNSYVGGCIYMLLLYFGERFPLGKAVDYKGKSPIQFWTKEKVKEMIEKEKKSDVGMLYTTKAGKDKAKKDTSERNFVSSLDPVLKDLHEKLMSIINDNHKRLVGAVEDELRNAQDHIGRQRKQHVGEDEDDCDDADDNGQDDEGDHEGHEGDSDGDVDGEAGYEDAAYVGTPIDIDEYDGASPTGEGGSNEGEQSISPYPEIFFDLISGTCTNDDKQQILIQIDDEDITREQLQTLGRRNKLSNRVMSVATTIKTIRDRFEEIIDFVKPNDKGNMPRKEIIWSSVPQQPNLQDCGVHVLIWLHNWKPNERVLYAKGSEAIEVYNKMKEEGVEPDLVTYNTLIFGLSKAGRVKEAKKFLGIMADVGHFPDEVTYTSLMNGMCREGNALGALALLEEMEAKGCSPNSCTYNTLLHGLCKSRMLDKAIELYGLMKSGGLKLETASYATFVRTL
ncbi:hypothetical protein K1719_045704 [Acacia pycnantha]|nr:hypothetical protein K1719_045704 [Acacia pycnantha]